MLWRGRAFLAKGGKQFSTKASCPVATLRACNLVADTTSEKLADVLQAKREGDGGSLTPSVYVGFDPTARSLHVGNLVSIRALQAFQAHGFRPIALVGGGTGFIGDPSGKRADRVLLDNSELAKNQSGIEACLRQVLSFSSDGSGGGNSAKLVNNIDWYENMSAFEFVRDIGQHFRVSQMMGRESVKQRLASEVGISYTEFSYQMFQAYDFFHLCDKENCVLQIGGSDQWGNIASGIDFIRRKYSQGVDEGASDRQAYGLTVPLLTTSSGEKFGKSAGNAVWLDPSMTSPFEFYQYFMQASDADAAHLVPMLAIDLSRPHGNEGTYSLSRAREVLVEHAQDPGKRYAQKFLADSLTSWVHGSDALENARLATETLFKKTPKSNGDSAEDVARHLRQLLENDSIELVEVSRTDLEHSTVVELAALTGAVKSKGEAKRLVKNGGLYLNQKRVQDVNQSFRLLEDTVEDNLCTLRVGRKKQVVIKIVE